MPKFNLKTYQKIDGDEHIDRRLQESHEEAPNKINEAQLEKGRVEEANVLIEKLLEKKRSGEAEQVTEKRLNDVKANFNIKTRNPEAYKGDINKLEEKRLLNDPVEGEKYETSSKTPKGLRWWELSTEEGHKLAQKRGLAKIAQHFEDVEAVEDAESDEMKFDDPRWQDLPSGEDSEDPEKEFQITDKSPEMTLSLGSPAERKPMDIVKQKDLAGPVSGIYMLLNYDVEDYEGDVQKIKASALHTIIEARPELNGLITSKDLVVKDETEEGVGQVILRALGDEFAAVANKSGESDLDEVIANVYDEVSYNENEAGGTTTAMGSVKVNTKITPDNEEDILKNAIDFIKTEHPNITISEQSLDTSKIEEGIISYMAGVAQESAQELEAQENFDITEVVASTSNKKSVVAQVNQENYYTKEVAGNPNTPPETLVKILMKGLNDEVSCFAAYNPNCPPTALAEILRRGKNDQVSCYAAQNPKCPPDVLAELLQVLSARGKNDKNVALAQCAAKNPNCPPEALKKWNQFIFSSGGSMTGVAFTSNKKSVVAQEVKKK